MNLHPLILITSNFRPCDFQAGLVIPSLLSLGIKMCNKEWCPGPDSNRQAITAGDFKSPVFTISPPGHYSYCYLVQAHLGHLVAQDVVDRVLDRGLRIHFVDDDDIVETVRILFVDIQTTFGNGATQLAIKDVFVAALGQANHELVVGCNADGHRGSALARDDFGAVFRSTSTIMHEIRLRHFVLSELK